MRGEKILESLRAPMHDVMYGNRTATVLLTVAA